MLRIVLKLPYKITKSVAYSNMFILFDNIGKQASKSPHSIWVVTILMAYKMISPHLLELRHIDRSRGLAPRAAKLVIPGTSLDWQIKSLVKSKTRFTNA